MVDESSDHDESKAAVGHHSAGMTLAEAQARVDRSIRALGGYWPPLANLARLFEECGELSRAVNQAAGPKRVKPGEERAAVADELGDVLYTLLVLANSLDVDAEAALASVLEKVRVRAGHGAESGGSSRGQSET